MNSYIIRTAEATDLPTIMQLVASAKAIMRKSGNTNQWNDGYPSEDIIMEDIKSGKCCNIVFPYPTISASTPTMTMS